jgi:hypothetical protein
VGKAELGGWLSLGQPPAPFLPNDHCASDHQRCEGRPAQFYIPCERLRPPWAQPLGDHGGDSGCGPQRSKELKRRLDSGRLPPKYAGMSLPRAYLSQKLTEPLPTKDGAVLRNIGEAANDMLARPLDRLSRP